MIAIIIGLLLLLGGGAAFYVYAQQQAQSEAAIVTPIDTKKLFYDAIENHMKVSYIQQEYDTEQVDESSAKTTGQVTGISDFTDPAKPKSKITYSVETPGVESPLTMAGEIVDLNDGSYYSKLTKSPAFTDTKSQAVTDDFSLALDTWYKVPNSDAGMSMILFDPAGMRKTINATGGQVLVGNYKDSIRQELMQFIDDNQIYVIKGTESVTVDKKPMTQYNITIDDKSLKKLNKKAESLLGISTDDTKTESEVPMTADVKYEFLIDNDSKHLIQVKLERQGADKKSTDAATIILSYPKSVADDIKKPSVVKDLAALQ